MYPDMWPLDSKCCKKEVSEYILSPRLGANAVYQGYFWTFVPACVLLKIRIADG